MKHFVLYFYLFLVLLQQSQVIGVLHAGNRHSQYGQMEGDSEDDLEEEGGRPDDESYEKRITKKRMGASSHLEPNKSYEYEIDHTTAMPKVFRIEYNDDLTEIDRVEVEVNQKNRTKYGLSIEELKKLSPDKKQTILSSFFENNVPIEKRRSDYDTDPKMKTGLLGGGGGERPKNPSFSIKREDGSTIFYQDPDPDIFVEESDGKIRHEKRTSTTHIFFNNEDDLSEFKKMYESYSTELDGILYNKQIGQFQEMIKKLAYQHNGEVVYPYQDKIPEGYHYHTDIGTISEHGRQKLSTIHSNTGGKLIHSNKEKIKIPVKTVHNTEKNAQLTSMSHMPLYAAHKTKSEETLPKPKEKKTPDFFIKKRPNLKTSQKKRNNSVEPEKKLTNVMELTDPNKKLKLKRRNSVMGGEQGQRKLSTANNKRGRKNQNRTTTDNTNGPSLNWTGFLDRQRYTVISKNQQKLKDITRKITKKTTNLSDIKKSRNSTSMRKNKTANFQTKEGEIDQNPTATFNKDSQSKIGKKTKSKRNIRFKPESDLNRRFKPKIKPKYDNEDIKEFLSPKQKEDNGPPESPHDYEVPNSYTQLNTPDHDRQLYDDELMFAGQNLFQDGRFGIISSEYGAIRDDIQDQINRLDPGEHYRFMVHLNGNHFVSLHLQKDENGKLIYTYSDPLSQDEHSEELPYEFGDVLDNVERHNFKRVNQGGGDPNYTDNCGVISLATLLAISNGQEEVHLNPKALQDIRKNIIAVSDGRYAGNHMSTYLRRNPEVAQKLIKELEKLNEMAIRGNDDRQDGAARVPMMMIDFEEEN